MNTLGAEAHKNIGGAIHAHCGRLFTVCSQIRIFMVKKRRIRVWQQSMVGLKHFSVVKIVVYTFSKWLTIRLGRLSPRIMPLFFGSGEPIIMSTKDWKGQQQKILNGQKCSFHLQACATNAGKMALSQANGCYTSY